MRGLLIIGAGGHAKVVADTALETQKWDNIAFLDDRYPALKSLFAGPILGKIEQAHFFLPEYQDLIVAIGNNFLRVNLMERFAALGFNLPTIIHPTAFVSKYASIDRGCVIFAQAAVNACAKIGMASIVNTGAIVEHDCIVNKGVHISPSAKLAGAVKVGDFSWIGIGSAIIQEVSIGNNVIIGAGAVITKNVQSDVTIVGVPGKIIKQHGLNDGGN